MKIIFVCKHNRFRSKVAEAIFNTEIQKFLSHKLLKNKKGVSDKLSNNNNVKAESAGLVPDEAHPYVADAVLKEAKKGGIILKESQDSSQEGCLIGLTYWLLLLIILISSFFMIIRGRLYNGIFRIVIN